MKKFILPLHFLLLLVFNKAVSQELLKVRLDLDKAYGGPFSNYLEQIKYIPLETTKASLFGQISQLIITDSSFVITDGDTRSVLFFSNSGKFIRRISKNGSLSATGAIFDPNTQSISVAFENAERSKLLIDRYSLKGDFLTKGMLSKSDIDVIRNKIGVNDDIFWVKNNIYSSNSNTDFRFFSRYYKGNKLNSEVPISSANSYCLFRLTKEIGYTPPPLLKSGIFYFSTPIEHKLYKISAISGECEPVMQIIFSAKFGIKNNVLAIKESRQMDSVLKTKWFTEYTILSLENIQLDKNKLIFKTKTGYFGYHALDGSITTRNFLYGVQNNSLVAFEKIYPDSSTYFLPYSEQGIISYEGFHFYKSYMYTHISSLNMFGNYEATKGKHPKYPSELVEYFKAGNRKNNPVIVRMKLKD